MTRLDRRALFSIGGAAALLAATGISLEAKPRPGGHLRIALPRDGKSLDLLANRAAFDTLTEIASNGLLKGELALQWQSDSESRRWQIDLRQDVTFHDGTPLLAEHVAESLRAHLGSASNIETPGDFRLFIELQSAMPDLPFVLAKPDLAIKLDGLIGTGCYQSEQFDPERRFIGGKVRNHYKSGHAGWVNTIEAVVITDSFVRAEALRDGFVDLAVFPNPELLGEMSDVDFHPSAENIVFATKANVGKPDRIGSGPLDDGRISERWWML